MICHVSQSLSIARLFKIELKSLFLAIVLQSREKLGIQARLASSNSCYGNNDADTKNIVICCVTSKWAYGLLSETQNGSYWKQTFNANGHLICDKL